MRFSIKVKAWWARALKKNGFKESKGLLIQPALLFLSSLLLASFFPGADEGKQVRSIDKYCTASTGNGRKVGLSLASS